MSVRGTRGFSTGRPRVSQIFKKRNALVNADVPINSNATLLATITLAETATIYAIKLALFAFGEASVVADVQRVVLWIRCVAAGSGLTDLTQDQDMDTINGFPAVMLCPHGTNQDNSACYINEKFRFRRKCDDNSLLQLIAQHTNVQGTGRVVNVSGLMTAILRVR